MRIPLCVQVRDTIELASFRRQRHRMHVPLTLGLLQCIHCV
jgi:hypothetical protein